ncbi:MAG: RICIN domain-containing protein [Dysgonamonadaceae bacterium]|jgi:hypothetical protein|nr:RICIN domain-containing protein [Dysgonamonadaceae bacterium]
MKKVMLICFCLTTFSVFGQNYLKNGSFEYGLNAAWEYKLTSTSKATFMLDQSSKVMDGNVALKIDVTAISVTNVNSIRASTYLTAGKDSLYLLRFWARGPEESKVYVEVVGSETPGILYEMHTGKTLFYFPFKFDTKKTDKELTVNFYFRDSKTKQKITADCKVNTINGATYYLDGVEVLDQNNNQNIDVYNTYLWNSKLTGAGWVAGDNDVSLALPDGRVIWFFNDSFYATPNPLRNRLNDFGKFIRNGVVVQQSDGTLTTYPITEQGGQWVYFKIPDGQEIKEGNSVKNIFWVGDAIMEDGKVKVHLIECLEASGGVVNTNRSYIASFSYPALEYLGMEKQEAFCARSETFFVDDADNKIYLYRTEDASTWDRYTHVARTNVGNLTGKNGDWEFWNGAEWTTNKAEGDSPAGRVNNMMADGVTKLGPGSYAQVSMPPMSHDVQVSFAPAPQGPWTAKQTVYSATPDSASWYYMPNFHGRLPNGNYSISFSANFTYCLFFCRDCDTWAFVDKYWYRPRYIQVDLIALSPYSEKDDCAGVAGGDAYIDECGECVGGTTGKEPCVPEPVYREGITGLSGIYTIQNKQSELYMSIENNSLENYAGVVQAEYSGNESQQFELKDTGDGYYNIINVASRLSIGIAGFSKAAEATVEQWNGFDYLDITKLPGGSISAQYEAAKTSEEIGNLIDDNQATVYHTANGRAWVQFHSATPKRVTRYSLMSAAANVIPRDPKNWALSGSNDGNNWVKLDTVSGAKFQRSEEKFFSIDNETAYSYYRMTMECYSGSHLQLAEWKLFEPVTPETGVDNQKFVVQDAGEGYVKFFTKHSDMVVEVMDGLNAPGVKVRQMPEIGQLGSLWKLTKIERQGIEEIRNEDSGKPKLIISPNPVKQTFNIQLPSEWRGSDFFIYNINGVSVYSGKVSDASFDIAHLPAGYYVTKVRKNDDVQVARFIKGNKE